MTIFRATLEAMVFLLGIGVVGFMILAKRLVGQNIIQVLTPLVLQISVPCLVFSDILLKFEPARMPEWWYLPLIWIGFTLATLGLALAAGRLVPDAARREFVVSLFFPNAIFVPLAVLAGVFGPASLLITELFLLTLFFPALLFNAFDFFFLSPGRPPAALNWRIFLHPVVVATAAAMAIRLLHAEAAVPGFMLRITQSLGSLALPLIMLLIGGSIFQDFQNKGKFHWRWAGMFVLLKNFIWPGLALLGIWLARPPHAVAVLLFLLSAVPPVTTIPVLTGRAGGNVSLANQFLISSFLAAVLSIPLGMWLLQTFYPGLRVH